MRIENFFDISLKKATCIEGLSEDALRALINSIQISVADSNFGGFVLSSGGVQVKFRFGSDGSFQGVYAYMNGESVVLIPGTNSGELSIFKGAPSAINPGAGWKLEVDLTRSVLNQPEDQTQWQVFFATRVSVLNNFGD